jgi:hypothetical protein
MEPRVHDACDSFGALGAKGRNELRRMGKIHALGMAASS